MPIEVPQITLDGDFLNVWVHEHGAEAEPPTTIIQAGEPWSVNIRWRLTGTNWEMIAGTWHVHVALESIGPGPEVSLVDYVPAGGSNIPLPSPNGEYYLHLDVPGTAIKKSDVPHGSLPMKMVVLLTYENPLGERDDMAGYFEGPILQFYVDDD